MKVPRSLVVSGFPLLLVAILASGLAFREAERWQRLPRLVGYEFLSDRVLSLRLSALDQGHGWAPGDFLLTSLEGPAESTPRSPLALGRERFAVDIAPGGAARAEARLHLLFASALPEGKLRLSFRGGNGESRVMLAAVERGWGRNPSIKVNQVGYPPESPKIAQVGNWLGDLGPMPVDARHFRVVRVPSLELAFEGELELGVAGDLASGEDVFQAEFSPLQEPGRYRLEVPELGWSHPFAIESRVYENLFRSTGGRLYQQRNADLEAPFESPPEHPQLVRGGWFELGEATTSLESASTLWGAFSLALDLVGPGHFEDGVPDLLDELEWGMRWARSMQTGDGSVSPQVSHGRTGSLQVHAPTLAATARFAAMGAIHGRLLADHRPARARQALEAARQAWEFLEKHPPQESAEDSRALRLWAAAELYRTSGEPRFQDAYGRLSSTFQPDLTAAPESTLPFWAMALSRHADKDIKLDGQAREICLRAARLHLKWMNQSAYGIPRPRHPTASGGFSPATTGIAALVLLQGYHLGGGPEMLDACWRTPGFQLGSNPLGKCFVTGVGAGSVPHPGTPVPGPIWHLSGSQEPMASVNAAYYPPERPLVEEVEEGAYPALRRYLDDPRVSPMNQGTLRELGYVVAAYGVLSEGPAGLRPLGAWQP